MAADIEQLKMISATGKGSGTDLEHGEKLYEEHYTDCHGKNGEGNPSKAYPLIESPHYNYLLRQLQWIQNGKRRNTNSEMIVRIKAFTVRNMEALADYISRMPPDDARFQKPMPMNTPRSGRQSRRANMEHSETRMDSLSFSGPIY